MWRLTCFSSDLDEDAVFSLFEEVKPEDFKRYKLKRTFGEKYALSWFHYDPNTRRLLVIQFDIVAGVSEGEVDRGRMHVYVYDQGGNFNSAIVSFIWREQWGMSPRRT